MWKFQRKIALSSSRFTKHNLSGFTLLEAMVSLVVLSVVLLLANAVIKSSSAVESETSQNCQVEWHLFLNQFEHISSKWELKSVAAKKLIFSEGDNKVELSPYKNQLRIKKNGGYEPVLMRVIKTEFASHEGGIAFKIKMEDGKEYLATFYDWGHQ